ncbi:periplasmic heavy metal sensor [Palleronia sp.]|uniref:periplasmic heavy metal sensor n=1 Tax=Palleronia sp. TaxID=1940284 RepID=UPI0035C79DF7
MSLRSIPRPWRYLLFISLAINVAVAGVIIGSALDRHGPHRGPRLSGPIAPLVRSLPNEARRDLFADLKRMPRTEPDRRRGSFEALLSAIRAEPFEPEAVTAALREQRDLGAARLVALEDALAEQLARLSAEERADYADRLRALVRRAR